MHTLKGPQIKKDTRHEEWMRRIKELSSSIDPSTIDISDERTKYIKSK